MVGVLVWLSDGVPLHVSIQAVPGAAWTPDSQLPLTSWSSLGHLLAVAHKYYPFLL